MASKLAIEDIGKTAKLAKLVLGDAKLKKLSGEVSSILRYMEEIQKVDTSGVEDNPNPNEELNITREDVVEENRMLSQEAALSNAREIFQGYFLVKSVFEE